MTESNKSDDKKDQVLGEGDGADANPEIPPLPEDQELSLEDIDQLLQKEDPEFFNKVSAISSDKLSAAEIDETDFRGFKRRFKDFALKWSIRISNSIRDLALLCWRGGKAGFWKSVDAAKSGLAQLRSYLGHKQVLWSRLSRGLKLFFFLVVIGTLGAGYAFYWNLKTHWLFKTKDLFIASMEDRASEKFDLSDSEKLEPFFNSVRVTPNILLIQKSVVNIKPSASSGRNPMVAYEIFLEGINPDVVAEVKEREGMFRDLIHRTTAKFSYDELDTPEGKRELLRTIQQEINSVVQRGQIRAVRLKTIVLKP